MLRSQVTQREKLDKKKLFYMSHSA